MGRWSERTAVAGVGAAVLSIVIAAVPGLYFAYRAPTMRAVLETGVTLVGTLVAFLALGRYWRNRRLSDVAIALALSLLALTYPVLVAFPRALSSGLGVRVAEWAPLGARVLAVAVLAAAATLMVSSRRPPFALRIRRAVFLAVLAVGIGVVVLIWVAPRGAASVLPAELSEGADPFADPLVATIQFGLGLLFAGAALKFSIAARRRSDLFLGWLSVGCALGAAASLDYALFPSLNPSSLLAGDVVWAGAVVAWAIGAVEEITSYWSEIGRLARVDERRRLARDLHDGLAQELAFLVTHALTPTAELAQPEWLAQLRSAAERALAESRRAITALVADSSLPLAADLERAALDIADRTGARVDLDVCESLMRPDQQEELVRIVREAVTNATRHGRATHISVTFADGTRRVLKVADNGSGFDLARIAGATAGFGLVSMRERAEALGATLAVRSAPGHGTTVEVAWR